MCMRCCVLLGVGKETSTIACFFHALLFRNLLGILGSDQGSCMYVLDVCTM